MAVLLLNFITDDGVIHAQRHLRPTGYDETVCGLLLTANPFSELHRNGNIMPAGDAKTLVDGAALCTTDPVTCALCLGGA